MTATSIGVFGCVGLVALLVSGMPVAFAMAITGVVGFSVLVGPHAGLSMAAAEFFETFTSHSLTVIPLFILMGQVAFHAGISNRLFHTAYVWLGHLPGGLAMATIGACAGFGAICGSGPATAATMSAVALPAMRRYHYSMELGAGAVAAGGSLGMLIPPSVVFIVYAIMTEQSVGKLFLAGIVPGILISILFCLVIYIACVRRPELGPVGKATTWNEKWKALSGIIETLILFIVVIGGMFLGFFTPTEAAAVGAAGSIVIALVEGQMTLHLLRMSLFETIRTSCMVMIIVTGALIFGRFLAITQIPMDLANWLTGLTMPSSIIIACLVLFYLVAGCFVDALGLVLLTIPVFQPVVEGLGYDLIWFGVMIVVVTQMGVISPPVGICVYIVHGVDRDVPLQTIFKGALPFLFALIVAAVILTAFPSIALFLPGLME